MVPVETSAPAGPDPSSARSRDALAVRLAEAVARIDEPGGPVVVVDLDAFDANAADLVRRAGGTPIRLASKSVRVPALITRALGTTGFSGILGYSLREALWLVEQGLSDDVVVAYPTADLTALDRLLGDERAVGAVTIMVDDTAQLDLLEHVRRGRGGRVRVAIDVDAGLHVGRQSVGPQRSPLSDVAQVVDLAEQIVGNPRLSLVGVMTYEGQVAGVPDDVPGLGRAKSAVVRRIKQASITQLADRRAQVVAALRELTELEFLNAGGTGSLETSAQDPSVTEVAAGSGLFVPATFDHFHAFAARPAAFFGVPVVRRPSATTATLAGGGLVASGPAGKDRLPVPWAPAGLHVTGLEGAGEVQTPLTGPGARDLAVGDLVWFRHAKAGELMEHTTTVHLVRGTEVVESVTTYRGEGVVW